MNLFDILGPVMVGPSSSHTAGAARIGYVARRLLGAPPVRAQILLHGSFAATGRGHGTDRALVAGLLGYAPDDERIPHSFECAHEAGLLFTVEPVTLRGAHPNTALLRLESADGRKLELMAASLGGGRIKIVQIDGLDANFTGELPTLVVHNEDRPGYVAHVTRCIAEAGMNVATMQVYRDRRGGYAVMVVEVDQPIPAELAERIRQLNGILKVTYLNPEA